MSEAGVRGGVSRGRLNRILVATDGSPGACEAARFGGGVAAAFDSHVLLVTAAEIPSGYAYGVYALPAEIDAFVLAMAEQALDATGRILDELGVEHEDIILRGVPAEAILDAAEDHDVDLIVVGHRGLGAVGRLFLGSVSNKIAHKAHCAVLVAPVAEDENCDTGLSATAELTETELEHSPWEGEPPTIEDLHAAFAAEGLDAIVWSNVANHVYQEHFHLEHQILRCAAGSATIRTSKGEYHIKPGDRIRIPAFVPHTTVAGPEGVCCFESREGAERRRPDDLN